IGLITFDLCGLKILTAIKKSVDLIRQHINPNFRIEAISLEEIAVYERISSDKNLGIFGFESPDKQRYLSELRPSCFGDIAAATAIFCPSLFESGMVDAFIERKHKKKEISYPLPQLVPILKETYGVIIYQEQIQKIAYELANYTLGEADLLRKAIGKRKPDELERHKTSFLHGAKLNSIDQKIAERIFDLMMEYGLYAFSKSHAIAYGLLSYQSAYLKTFYPEYFNVES
ncbi:MAG: DNA polymerase III subunit alpha, partial [Oligoflexales bacterium]|nr:DNA polymerase III subunit alpha [Oligoflexales bacterium]